MPDGHIRRHEADSSTDDARASAEAQDAWLRIGARPKAESIIRLAGSQEVRDVLEIGAGSGAVLAELDRRGFGERYYACEPSEALIEQLRRRHISRLEESHGGFLRGSPFAERRFDLCVLSHVLEHVPAPAELLLEALRVSPLVLVEVPLEGNRLGDVRARVKTRLSGQPRTLNSAGHIHFWSQRDVSVLVDAVGGRIVGARRYFPTDAYRALASDPIRKMILAASQLIPERAFSSLYHGHLALLVERAQAVDPGHPMYA